MLVPGDRVRIRVHDWDSNTYRGGEHIYAYGKTGTILKIAPRAGSPDVINYVVRMDASNGSDIYDGWLYLDAVEPIDPKPVMDPDVSLDEIHQFQELVERS